MRANGGPLGGTAGEAAARAVRQMRRGPIITVSSMRRKSERLGAWDWA
jgi:hypothetical protein